MAVRQRTKRSSITAENDFASPQGPIHLLVHASLDDWKKLLSLTDNVRLNIFNSILQEGKDRIKSSARNLPRGLTKDDFGFVQRTRLMAHFTSKIIRSYSGTDFYEKLIENFQEETGAHTGGKEARERKPTVTELTAFVMSQIFAKQKKRYSIRGDWVEDPDNFRRIYLDWSKAKKSFDFYFMGQKKDFSFYFMLQEAIVCNEFKRYIERSENPLKVFKLFFKEKSSLMKMY